MKKDEIAELTKEAIELAIDQLVTNELVKEIPVVNVVVNLLKLGTNSIPDYLFARKLNVFLNDLDSVPEKEKVKLKNKLASKEKNVERLYEQLLNCINKLSDERKASFIARVFLGYINEVVDLKTFKRSLEAIDMVFVDDLYLFVDECAKNDGALPSNQEIFDNMPSIFNSSLAIDNAQTMSSPYSNSQCSNYLGTLSARDIIQKEVSPLGLKLLSAYEYGNDLLCKR
ncbi:hypothetical protein HUO09_03825 [Vibrio sp. Y2-5]|uniref:hypothetical protein n=1 Tax=Vibrio sp. Y2-5 TaxID=2743977 RepID=UPI001660FA47|nr:hypothetical protein [Vibrio sp. Y2-5]MBD0785454.1 hypothetical protein [Vibrio sp. Y2-5]